MKEAMTPQRGLALALKRTLDLSAAGAGLLLSSPLMVGLSAAIYLTMGRPIFFCQERPGKGEKIFAALKFRSMRQAPPGELGPESDGERLTALGAWMRRTSLDELPQLINVLRGEMSLVGPRPLLVRYLERYDSEQRRRHWVLPGITGWAQVNGRNATSWPERFAHDLYYVDHWSLGLDLRILGRTALKVVRRDGISQAGVATMEEFPGNPHG